MNLRMIVLGLAVLALASCVSSADRKACEADDPDTRIRGCTAAIASDSWNKLLLPGDYFNRSTAYFSKHQYELAIGDATKAIQFDPGMGLAYARRGASYEILGRYDEAIADTTTAIRLLHTHPDLALAYLYRGYAHREKRLFDDANADISMVIQLAPGEDWAYIDRSTVLERAGHYDLALLDATTAIQLQPLHSDGYNERAWIYHLMGEDALGLPAAEQAVALDARNAAAIETLAEIHEKLGDLDKATVEYRSALTLSPHMQSARQGMGRLEARAQEKDAIHAKTGKGR